MDRWASARLPLHHAMHLGSDENDQLSNQSYLDILCSIHKSWKLLALAWQCQLRKEGSMVMSFKNFPIMVSCDGRSCKWRKKVNFYFALQSLDIKIIIANHTYNKRLIRIDHLKYLAQVYRGPKLNLFAIVITQSKDESSKWGSYPLKVPRFCSTNAFKIMFFSGWDQT